jgi:hypothetical protein
LNWPSRLPPIVWPSLASACTTARACRACQCGCAAPRARPAPRLQVWRPPPAQLCSCPVVPAVAGVSSGVAQVQADPCLVCLRQLTQAGSQAPPGQWLRSPLSKAPGLSSGFHGLPPSSCVQLSCSSQQLLQEWPVPRCLCLVSYLRLHLRLLRSHVFLRLIALCSCPAVPAWSARAACASFVPCVCDAGLRRRRGHRRTCCVT